MAVYEPTDNHTRITADGRITREQHGETTVIVRYLHLMRPVRVAFIPARPGFAWTDPPTANAIDEHVFAKLRRLRVNPSSLCDDATFIRRASLDICGVIPTAAEARAFVDDPTPDKRARLIDTLMQRPEFADHWALKWADLLRNEEKVLDSKGVSNFHHWIRASIVANKPLDVFARELLTARGSTYANPPANYYRAMRTTTARSEATAQLFLGTRLSCAKCHSHPFEKWTQDDYYGFAALFAGVEYKIIENRRRDKNDKNQFIGEQVVWVDPEGTIKDPRNGRPADPRLLGELDREVPRGAAGLDRLAEWMTSPGTDGGRLFARVMANRIWAAMIGRGVVEPIDDFRATNPPSNPALLDTLTAKLIDSGYDLRATIRFIAGSRVYQLAATPNDTNAADRNFSRAIVRRLTAEQLIDSMAVALNTPTRFNGFERPLRAAELPGVNAVYRDSDPSPADRFVKMFGKPPRLTSCACERTEETALNQVFELTSGELINELLTASGNRLDTLLKTDTPDHRIVDDLYWAILTRAPTYAELRASSAHLSQSSNRRSALEDIAWSLLNAKAFLLRR